MPPRKKAVRGRGLGASDFAHATMAGAKLLDVETVLVNSEQPGMRCDGLLSHYQVALASWGNAEAHLRSGVPKADHPGLHDRLEQHRKRLVRLDGKIRRCFCER